MGETLLTNGARERLLFRVCPLVVFKTAQMFEVLGAMFTSIRALVSMDAFMNRQD